jgi:hypothetical protein
VAVDSEKLTGAELYKVTALPTTIFTDRAHKVTLRQIGFSKQHEKLFEEEIRKLAQ